MSIGEKIRLLRMEKNLTQEQLAAAFDISVSAVSQWESGRTTPEYPLLCSSVAQSPRPSPGGTPGEIAAKVRELRDIFPTGLIISPSHEALLPDVPPENVKTMFDEVGKVY